VSATSSTATAPKTSLFGSKTSAPLAPKPAQPTKPTPPKPLYRR